MAANLSLGALPITPTGVAVAAAATLATAGYLWSRLPKPYELSMAPDTGATAEAIKFPKYNLPPVVLLTGGCGFLGRHLVDALLEQRACKVAATQPTATTV